MYIQHHHPDQPDSNAQLMQLTEILRFCIGKLYLDLPQQCATGQQALPMMHRAV